jgi:hypothetical protein
VSQQPYACYDMETDDWIVRPKPITSQFYGEGFMLVMPKAEDVAIQAESHLSELNRNIVNWQFWTAMFSKYNNPRYRQAAEDSRQNADLEKQGISNLFEGVFGGRREAYSPEGKGIEDERDILQKLLEVWGIFQDLKHYARAPLPWEEQEVDPSPLPDTMVDRGQERSCRVTQDVADWGDVQEKAQRYYYGDNVEITVNNPPAEGQPGYVEGKVQGSQSDPLRYVVHSRRSGSPLDHAVGMQLSVGTSLVGTYSTVEEVRGPPLRSRHGSVLGQPQAAAADAGRSGSADNPWHGSVRPACRSASARIQPARPWSFRPAFAASSPAVLLSARHAAASRRRAHPAYDP